MKIKWCLVAATLLVASTLNANAAKIRVSTTDFSSNSSCNLINAILAAETDSAQGGCSAGSGEDEILIGGATYALPNTADDATEAALPIITTSIRITGQSATIKKADNAEKYPQIPLLRVGPTGRLSGSGFTLDEGWWSGLIIDGGSADLHNVTVTRQPLTGISILNGGSLTLTDSEVSLNKGMPYQTVGGIEVYNGSRLYMYTSVIRDNAGGIGNGFHGELDGTANIIYVKDSKISRNGSRRFGGISAPSSKLTLLNSVVSKSGAGNSPAVSTGDYPSLIEGALIVNNYGGFAPAVNAGAKTRIVNTTIRGNNCSYCQAGGIYAEAGAEIVNTVVLGNTGKFAGGIVTNGQVTIKNSTIAGNTVIPYVQDDERQHRFSGGIASLADPNEYDLPIILQNTIVADNIGGHWQCAEDLLADSTNNFTSDGSCEARYAGETSPFDLSAVDKETARYWPLRSDHIVSTGGDVSTCTATDMLGTNRLDDGVCSLGSIEYTRSGDTAPTGNSDTTNTDTSGTTTTEPASGSTGVLGANGEKTDGQNKGGGMISLQLFIFLILLQLGFRSAKPCLSREIRYNGSE